MRFRRGMVAALLLALVGSCLGFLAAPAGAAAKKATTGGVITTNVAMQYDGQRRAYQLIRPDGPTTGLPLLVFLHGRSALPSVEAKRDGFLPLVAAGKMVLVYPGGVGGSWNSNDGCCGLAQQKNEDDMGFVLAVTAQVKAQWKTKGQRTYLAGYSNGGKLVMDIACNRPSGFAAFAEYGANPEPCPQRARAPFWLGQGMLDTEEPYNGRATDKNGIHPGLTHGISAIATKDGCHGNSTSHVGTATILSWTHCAHGALQVVEWSDQTHLLPMPPRVKSANYDLTTLMWSFLYAHLIT